MSQDGAEHWFPNVTGFQVGHGVGLMDGGMGLGVGVLLQLHTGDEVGAGLLLEHGEMLAFEILEHALLVRQENGLPVPPWAEALPKRED